MSLLTLLGLSDSDIEAVKVLAPMGTEALRTTGKGIDVIKAIVGPLMNSFSTVPRDFIAWQIGDRITRARIRNYIGILEEFQERINRISDDRRTPASQTLALPLLEAAVDEDRPELREMWADLLASTAIDGGQNYRAVFRNIVGRMEPIDAVIFREAARLEEAVMLYESEPAKSEPPPPPISGRVVLLDQHVRRFGFRDDAIRFSFQELQNGLGLLMPSANFPALTALGRALASALGAAGELSAG
jgi:hypothetical protein